MQFRLLKGSNGTGLVELAVVLPVILLIILSGVELARSIRVHSRITTIVKEVTAVGFRNCANIANPAVRPETTAQIQAEVDDCLNRSIGEITPSLSAIIDTSKIQISLSLFRDVTNTLGGSAAGELVATRSFQSQVIPNVQPIPRTNPTDFTVLNNPYRNLLLRNQYVMVYGEVLYSYSPLIPPIAGIFNFNNGAFYAVSAF